jgi:hypothetical protein
MSNTAHPTESAETMNTDPSIIIEGMRFRSDLYDPKVIRSALEYVARANDIFIVTAPKSGTTWMQTIVYGLLNNGRAFDEDLDDYIAHNPYLEMHGPQAVEAMQRPGAIKTHVLFDYLPYHPSAKYICVLRNAKDVCVSFHRFITSIKGRAPSDITFDELFDSFLAGKTCHADYFDHLLSCWSHKDDTNVLIVLYEDMKKDIRSVINRLASFLNIEMNEKLLESIVTVSSFDYMKKARYNEKIVPAHSVATFKFLRKGIVGDWQKVLSNEQSRLLDARFNEKTRDIQGLNTLWHEYDVFAKE